VGGIKEKVLAAKRAGVREIDLPADNEPNVHEDLTQDLLEGLTLHYVKTIGEVVDLALEKEPTPIQPGPKVPAVALTSAGPPN
jgi:ATP-dependent Lon protease